MSRPHVTLKLATSLDGRIATASGESRWITGEEARAEVHRMRARADAVMIGAGTARADNPHLIARTTPPPPRQPTRIVLDSSLSIEPRGRLFHDLDQSPLGIIGVVGADASRRAALEAAGAYVDLVEASTNGVNLTAVLSLLANSAFERLLVEGGGVLAASLISERLVDRIEWFRSPILLGAEGRPAVGALAMRRLADASAWRRVALRELGPDLWESYERAS